MMTISEGSKIEGGDLLMREREDSFGHRKLGGIGAVAGDLLREITGEHIIYQQLAYLMRSGRPDSLDLMVATNYAVMAADLASTAQTGRMVALRQGIYTDVPLTLTREGVKRVDVDALYDSENYRPKVRQVAGTPMFLY
jgi:6-phosphofructokinase 1